MFPDSIWLLQTLILACYLKLLVSYILPFIPYSFIAFLIPTLIFIVITHRYNSLHLLALRFLPIGLIIIVRVVIIPITLILIVALFSIHLISYNNLLFPIISYSISLIHQASIFNRTIYFRKQHYLFLT